MTVDTLGPVTPTATETIQLRPYEYAVLPPIGRVLQAIRAHCGVGGTIQPGVRQLAEWANYASAGRISPLLQQLADDGWILYDAENGHITLLAEPITECDQEAITEGDQGPITASDQAITASDRSELIPAGDRGLQRPSPLLQAITRRDRSASRMEDHVLAAADQESDSAAATKNLPCSAESITPRDHPAALILAELGADERIIAEALAARPDLTPEQVRASWTHFEARIAAGSCTAGAFFHAIRRGKLHAAPRDLRLDPAAYAGDPQFLLDSSPPPAAPAESLYDRAQRLIPRDVTGVAYRWAMDVLMRELAAGAMDEQALDALAQQQPRRPGGGAGGGP